MKNDNCHSEQSEESLQRSFTTFRMTKPSFQRMNAIALRIYFLMRGSPARVVQMFVWVLIDITLWGFITRYLGDIAIPGKQFVPLLLGAVLMWDFFTRVTHGLAVAFFEDVWSRNFLNVFASPVTIYEYLGGLVMVSVVTSLMGLVAMLLLAGAAFGLSIFAYGAMIVPFLFILFLFGIAVGIAGSAMVLRFGPSSEWFVWPIPALLSPLAAVFYPLSVLPGWMQALAHVLPPAYVFEGIRAILAGGSPPWEHLVIGGGLAMLYIFLACRLFAGVHRFAVKSGLIARYSAESAG